MRAAALLGLYHGITMPEEEDSNRRGQDFILGRNFANANRDELEQKVAKSVNQGTGIPRAQRSRKPGCSRASSPPATAAYVFKPLCMAKATSSSRRR